MNSLDRIIKAERRSRYKHLKRLTRARDMASKYVNRTMTISKLDEYFSPEHLSGQFTGSLARMIVARQNRIIDGPIKPPKPPSQK